MCRESVNGIDAMNAATITKTINKVRANDQPQSIGFKRYIALPQQIRQNLHTCHLLETGSSNAHDRIVKFFGEMTDEEYVAWMKFNTKSFSIVVER